MYIIWLPFSRLHGWHLAKLPTGGPHEITRSFFEHWVRRSSGCIVGIERRGRETEGERQRELERERERGEEEEEEREGEGEKRERERDTGTHRLRDRGHIQ